MKRHQIEPQQQHSSEDSIQCHVNRLYQFVHSMTNSSISSNDSSSSNYDTNDTMNGNAQYDYNGHENNNGTITTRFKNDERRRIAIEQIDVARGMLERIKQHDQVSLIESTGGNTIIVPELETMVEEACAFVTERYIGNNASDEVKHDLVHDIFFNEDDNDEDEELDNDNMEFSFSDEEENINATDEIDENDDEILEQINNDSTFTKNQSTQKNDIPPPPLPKKKEKKKKLTTEELQKQQEEQLQQEISSMAAQLKQSTMNINTTLASQNRDLDNVETLAQNNLDKTKNVQEDVTDHVKATGWRKSFGRWMVFFIILGTWIFCFFTMRIVPKRKGACLFFCEEQGERSRSSSSSNKRRNNRERDYDDDYYSNEEQEDQSSSKSSSKRTVEPKYSFCHENDDGNSKSCTSPGDIHQHSKRVHAFDSIDRSKSTDFAYSILSEKKEKRHSENLIKAMNKETNIGVRDGWDDENIHENEEEDEVSYEDVIDAALDDSSALVEMLLKNPDFIDNVDENGWTLLHEVCRAGKLDSVATILRFLSDDDDDIALINVRTGVNQSGGNAFWLAKNAGHDDIVQLLIENGGVELPPLSELKNQESDQYYYDDDDDDIETDDNYYVEEEDDDSYVKQYTHRDAVIAAVHNPSLLSTILEQNPSILEIIDENGWNILHEASRGGNVESVQVILNHINDGNFKHILNARTSLDGNGGNALWFATRLGHNAIVRLLESNGGEELSPIEDRSEL